MFNDIANHLTEVNMTYTQHFLNSFDYSGIFFIAFLKAFIHAFCPNLYKTSSTDFLNSCCDINHNHNKNNEVCYDNSNNTFTI
tara:strand:+ start:328 stop:576 length:249 start_codon:yes stop_codon:yes gene_type:complete